MLVRVGVQSWLVLIGRHSRDAACENLRSRRAPAVWDRTILVANESIPGASAPGIISGQKAWSTRNCGARLKLAPITKGKIERPHLQLQWIVSQGAGIHANMPLVYFPRLVEDSERMFKDAHLISQTTFI